METILIKNFQYLSQKKCVVKMDQKFAPAVLFFFFSHGQGCSHTPGHGFDHRFWKGPETGGEGTAPAFQNMTEGRTRARVRFHDVRWPKG